MSNGRVLALITIVLVCGNLTRAEEFKLPTPAPVPSSRPFVPEGENPFNLEYATIIPGTRIWTQWLTGGIWQYPDLVVWAYGQRQPEHPHARLHQEHAGRHRPVEMGNVNS
jgi:hypothetical protein